MAVEFQRRRQLVSCLLLHPGTVDTDLSAPFQKVLLLSTTLPTPSCGTARDQNSSAAPLLRCPALIYLPRQLPCMPPIANRLHCLFASKGVRNCCGTSPPHA